MSTTNLHSLALGLLGGADWRTLAESELTALLREQLLRRAEPLGKIAARMAAEGWSWSAAQDPEFLARQRVKIPASEHALGPGHVLARDVVYALFREAGVEGGAARDLLRDTLDQDVTLRITPPLTESDPLTAVVERTAAAWAAVVAERLVSALREPAD